MHGMRMDSACLKFSVAGNLMKTFLLCICLLYSFSDVYSQNNPPRPSIGLVLSGGAAHGIAHLGVLKVMEEAGLKPDYITGVSMGSVIGAMYSLGYSADSIYSILKHTDWDLILSNRIPENKVIFLEKDNIYNSIITLPTSSSGFSIPSGLINGQSTENMLSYYMWPAADISDFSKLPIPFLCIGADIISFKKIDLKSGYLPDAVRASIAVPSIFTPSKIDTLILVDGGLLRNFAASEAKEMGADILIGSYAGFKAYSEDELKSLPGVIKQIAFSRSLEDFDKEKKLVDILITHHIDLPRSKFENTDSIFNIGYRDALPYEEHFRRLADSLNRIAPPKPVENILNKQYYRFDKIVISGNKIYPDYQIKGILDIEPGERVDKILMNEKIDLLYGRSWFNKVTYRIIPRNNSLILNIECEEKPNGMLYGSVHYDNSLKAGIILKYSVKDLFTSNSMISLDSYIAQYFRFRLNMIQFLNRNQKTGLYAGFNGDNTLMPMFSSEGEKGDMISRNFITSLGINRSIGLNHLMILSLQYENRNLVPQYHSERQLKNLGYNYLSSYFKYFANTLNKKYFPDSGLDFSVQAGTSKLLYATIKTDSSRQVIRSQDQTGYIPERFYTIYGHIRYYFSPSKRTTLSIGGDILYITGADSVSSGNNFYLLGGIESVSQRSVALVGYHANQVAVNRLTELRGNADIEFFKDIHLEIMANAAMAEETGGSDMKFYTGVGLGVGYMSVIGPLKIGIMYGNNKSDNYFNRIKGYISIGFRF
jgi:NTE family protein